MNCQSLFDDLNQLDETPHIEAKRGRSSGQSAMETVIAFSNEPGLGGGHILFGVVRNTVSAFPKYVIEGVEDPDQLQLDFVTQCGGMLNRPIRPSIQVEIVEGKTLVCAFIAEAPVSAKPIRLKNKPIEHGTYRRVGSSDFKCTEDDFAAILDGWSGETFDSSIVSSADLDDFDLNAIAEYKRIRRESNNDHSVLEWPDTDLLYALGCLKKDNGEYSPTVTGILLFGTPMALRRLFPMARVDYIRISGKEWVADDEDRYISTIGIQDNLINLIKKTFTTIVDSIPKSFSLKNGELQRTESPIIPSIAIREAVVNAIMHRSYKEHSPIQIIHYSNRIEITNPGYSIKATEALSEGASKSRNPKISAILYETKFAETKGTGIKAIQKAMEKAGLTAPTFVSSRTKNQFTAIFMLHHFLDQGDIEWLAQFKAFQLSEEDSKALIWCREYGMIDNSKYRAINHTDILTASNHLRRLRDLGLLDVNAAGSATFYTPTKTLLGDEPLAETTYSIDQPFSSGLEVPLFQVEDLKEIESHKAINITDSKRKDQELSGKDQELSGKDQELSGKDQELSGKDQELQSPLLKQPGSSEENFDTQSEKGGGIYGAGTSGKLLKEFDPTRAEATYRVQAGKIRQLRKKGAPDEIETLIHSICRLRSFNAEEIGKLFDRSPEYMRNSYLTPMIKKELLEYEAGPPTHPQQRYKAHWSTLNWSNL